MGGLVYLLTLKVYKKYLIPTYTHSVL